MRSALNQYLNPQIPARIVSVGQKLVKITARGRNIEAAEATVLEVKRTYALVDDGFDFGPHTVNRDTGFERRSAHIANSNDGSLGKPQDRPGAGLCPGRTPDHSRPSRTATPASSASEQVRPGQQHRTGRQTA